MPDRPHPAGVAHCRFYVRTGDPGLFRYESVALASWAGTLDLPTPHPPLAGDLISLYDVDTHAGGQYRVIERAWSHASYGSVHWPYGEPLAAVGPTLDIIVVPDAGPFRDEAPAEEETVRA